MDDEATSAARKAMREFLHPAFIGCHFAPDVFRSADRVLWMTISAPELHVKLLTDLFIKSEENGRFAAALFPGINSVATLAETLAALGDADRWHVDSRDETIGSGRVTVVDLFWTRSDGERASVLGMAPLLSMPVTRRAPYVSMFAWPGARLNPHRKKPLPNVGIGDAPTPGMDEPTYKVTAKKTRDSARELNGSELPPTATFTLDAGAFVNPV